MENDINIKLKRKNIKPTAMRLLVYEVFAKNKKALSLYEIEQQFDNVDRSTIFRTLKTFQDNYLTHSIDDGSGAVRYALCDDDCTCKFESADGNMLSSGFETNIKLTYDDFSLYLNYAYINTELQYDNINNQKPLTPKHNAGFVLFYEIEDKWSAGYEVYYTGKQFDNLYKTKTDYWTMGVMIMRYFERFSVFANFENFTNVLQSNFEPLVIPPTNNPSFPDIWAPTDGFVFNGGIKFRLF